MAASSTVVQQAALRNSEGSDVALTPRHGVVTLFGYGISVRVDRGHLILEDGLGASRRRARYPRVGHGLKRLLVIGCDGVVSLAAIQWLADQDAALIVLDRDGKVLASSGSLRSSDPRMRRSQAQANQSGVGLHIARELITRKLTGQERVAGDKLENVRVAEKIAAFRNRLSSAETLSEIRLLEAQAGLAYWSAWHEISVSFPKMDLPSVPDHWRVFGMRHSPLSSSARTAINPSNAMLNYLYALLESEASLAAATLGLDPGMGFLHVDVPRRDSLACDLMETVRPDVDAFLFDWITRKPLHREWFFEQRNGCCRIAAPLATVLGETTATWAHAVAPIAEWVSQMLWKSAARTAGDPEPEARLTQQKRRQAKGSELLETKQPPKPLSICRNCGASVRSVNSYCVQCGAERCKETLEVASKVGRVAAQSRSAQAKRTETQIQTAKAIRAWRTEELPDWLTHEFYVTKIQPLLVNFTRSAIASAIGVSSAYASEVRAGHRVPHPRHWTQLAKLVGLVERGT